MRYEKLRKMDMSSEVIVQVLNRLNKIFIREQFIQHNKPELNFSVTKFRLNFDIIS